MYYLKLMEYEGEMLEQKQADEARIVQQDLLASFDNLHVEDHLADCGEYADDEELPLVKFYAGLLKWVYKAAAADVSRNCPDLGWDAFTEFTPDEQFPPQGQDIRVAIMVPAATLTSVNDRAFTVAAAEAAGISNFDLMSEPAGALASYIIRQPTTNTSESLIGKTLMMVDFGAGSVEFEVWTILGLHPLRARAEIVPQSEWLGARQANKHAKDLILSGIPDLDPILTYLSRQRGKTVTPDSFKKELDNYIEVAKRRPNNNEARYVGIRGLPMRPASRLHGAAGVLLSEPDWTQIWKQYHRPITDATEKYVQWVAVKKNIREDRTKAVDMIIASGGGIINTHVQEEFRACMKEFGETVYGDPIPVVFPIADPSHPSSVYPMLTQVAQGGLVLLADHDIVSERLAGRSYFIAKDISSSRRHGVFKYRIEPLYIVRKDDPVKTFDTYCIPYQGQVWDMGSEEYANEQHVFVSDRLMEDLIWLNQDEMEELTMDKLLLEYTLSREELEAFPKHRPPFDTANLSEECWKFDFMLYVDFDGNNLHFSISIPRTGVLSHSFGVGANPIKHDFKINIKGALRPVGAPLE